MKLRSARAADAGSSDVTVVPLFDDLTPPAGLGRGVRAIVERMGREHRASLQNPPKSPLEYLESLEHCSLTKTAKRLREYVDEL